MTPTLKMPDDIGLVLVRVYDIHGGRQAVVRFPNGYGASIVCHQYSYGGRDGLNELAVLKFTDTSWTLTYETPITDDVIGYLTEDAVNDLLRRIAALS